MRPRVAAFWVLVALLAVPAVILTTARLVEPSGRLGVGLVALTPLALPLYAVVLVLAGLRLAVVRRWRVVALPVAVVAVVGLVLHGWWYAPQVAGANPPPARDAAPMVVMSSNLRLGHGDGVEVVRHASEERVDLLVVQEVTPGLLAEMDGAGLGELLPYRVGRAASGAAGTMAFARVPLTDPVRLPTALGSWGFVMGDLRVLAVHPTYPVDTAGWTHEQEVIAHAVSAQRPDLLAGDFNATLDHRPMRRLADLGYRDVGELANAGWQPTWPADGEWDHVSLPLAQIDHVLVRSSLAALGMYTVAVPGTDHRAVVARVAPR